MWMNNVDVCDRVQTLKTQLNDVIVCFKACLLFSYTLKTIYFLVQVGELRQHQSVCVCVAAVISGRDSVTVVPITTE